MTLDAFLGTLKAKPELVGSPSVVFNQNDLTDEQQRKIKKPDYNYAPYIIYETFDALDTQMSGAASLRNGTIDIHVVQDHTSPDVSVDHAKNLASSLLALPQSVTHIGDWRINGKMTLNNLNGPYDENESGSKKTYYTLSYDFRYFL